MREIKEVLEEYNKKFEGKFGHYNSKLMLNWSKIVGSRIAGLSTPKKIVSYYSKAKKPGAAQAREAKKQVNMLHLEVPSSAISTEIAFSKEIIIEKIALFFGFKLISEVKTQIVPTSNVANFTSVNKKTKEQSLPESYKLEIMNELDIIDDEELKNKLYKLGNAVQKERKSEEN